MTIRVIQWATGAMGKTILRGLIDSPNFALVGLWCHGDDKAGRDAGDIAKRPPTGVRATTSIADILAIDADVVVHAARLQPPFERHDEDILRLLESGKSVISINGNSWPENWPNARRARFEAACKAGRSRFLGAGLNPGFAAERLLGVAAQLSYDIRSVTLRETVICAEIKSSDYVFDVLGFGTTAGAIDPNGSDFPPAATLDPMFRDVVAAMATNLGIRLDAIVTDHRMLPTQHPLPIAAGTIAAGGTSQIDWRWRGMAGGEAVANLEIAWAMDRQHLQDTTDGLWAIHIEGTPNVDLAVDLLPPAVRDGRTSAEQLGVAAVVLNAIPNMLAMPTGLLSASDWKWGRMGI